MNRPRVRWTLFKNKCEVELFVSNWAIKPIYSMHITITKWTYRNWVKNCKLQLHRRVCLIFARLKSTNHFMPPTQTIDRSLTLYWSKSSSKCRWRKKSNTVSMLQCYAFHLTRTFFLPDFCNKYVIRLAISIEDCTMLW